MGIDIHFDGAPVTNGSAPHNDKFGAVSTIEEAIAKARTAHEQAGGKKDDVDNEDVVIIAKGENLWVTWEKYAKPQGVSWEDFLQSNLHLKDPKNLSGKDQGGWKDWSLVHEGDAVFIPEGPSGGGSNGSPATVSDGNNSGPIVNKNGKWQFEMSDERGRNTYHNVAVGQTLTQDGVRYKIIAMEKDIVSLQPLKNDNTVDTSKKARNIDLNDVDR
jgi:hypothetical protein